MGGRNSSEQLLRLLRPSSSGDPSHVLSMCLKKHRGTVVVVCELRNCSCASLCVVSVEIVIALEQRAILVDVGLFVWDLDVYPVSRFGQTNLFRTLTWILFLEQQLAITFTAVARTLGIREDYASFSR